MLMAHNTNTLSISFISTIVEAISITRFGLYTIDANSLKCFDNDTITESMLIHFSVISTSW